jgi:hypothetical protein
MKQFPWRVFFQFVTYQVVFFGFAFLVVIVNLGFFSEASAKEVPALLWAKGFFYFSSAGSDWGQPQCVQVFETHSANAVYGSAPCK